MDINAIDFVESFTAQNFHIGIIGFGYVGKAVHGYFKDMFDVKVHDVAFPELGTLEDLLRYSDLIFVAVPTPMRKDGSCCTDIVESVFHDIVNVANKIEKNLDSFVVVHKSTVWPGFTATMRKMYPGLRLIFSPEFLTEKSSMSDFANCNRMLFGGDEEDALVASMPFQARDPRRIADDDLMIFQCDSTVAEMVKLYTNGILMMKVMFSNEVYQMCEKLNVSYDDVRSLSLLDKRIGPSHTCVPGHDGFLGAGGHCFIKDMNNLKSFCKKIGVQERLFTAALERNDEVREEEGRDWEKMKGRAVVDD